jgi:hypothetical protein
MIADTLSDDEETPELYLFPYRLIQTLPEEVVGMDPLEADSMNPLEADYKAPIKEVGLWE